MSRFFARILRIFYPPRCILCGAKSGVGTDALCKVCAEKPILSLSRAFAVHARRHDYTLQCTAPERYEGAFRDALWRFKFRGEVSLAVPIAARMAAAMGASAGFDCIAFVPTSKSAMKKRGYNPAALLAEKLSAVCGVPVEKTALIKIRENSRQHTLSAKARQKNVRGAFRAENVENRSVLLVDDIVTTGATARECARVLYLAGASHVSCVSAAMVP